MPQRSFWNLLVAGCWLLVKDVLNLHFASCILQSEYSLRGVAPSPSHFLCLDTKKVTKERSRLQIILGLIFLSSRSAVQLAPLRYAQTVLLQKSPSQQGQKYSLDPKILWGRLKSVVIPKTYSQIALRDINTQISPKIGSLRCAGSPEMARTEQTKNSSIEQNPLLRARRSQLVGCIVAPLWHV
jgi:hypothetical protein